jgi:hypothetical protein
MKSIVFLVLNLTLSIASAAANYGQFYKQQEGEIGTESCVLESNLSQSQEPFRKNFSILTYSTPEMGGYIDLGFPAMWHSYSNLFGLAGLKQAEGEVQISILSENVFSESTNRDKCEASRKVQFSRQVIVDKVAQVNAEEPEYANQLRSFFGSYRDKTIIMKCEYKSVKYLTPQRDKCR